MSRVPTHLRELLKPQEDFELLREDTLKRFGPRLCDLSYANAQDSAPESVRNAIIAAVQSSRPSDFQYSPYGGATVARRLAAQALSNATGVRFGHRDVVLVPGAMSGLNLVLQALSTGRDDEAVVITPCWLDYPLYLANHGYRMRKAPVDARTLRLDLAAIEAQLNANTRVVMLSQPANPSGLCYRADELAALGALLERSPSKPVLISDECHRDYVYSGELASPLPHYANTCIVYSIGKKLLMQGQRIGYVAVSPRMENAEAFRTDLVTWTRISGICTPTALMQRALGTLLEVSAPLGDVARRAKRLTGQLREAGYDVVEPDSTFFVYPKVPGDDFAFCRKLARLGVLALPAAVFHHSGHVRLSVTATDDVIERALPLLRQALTEQAA